MTSRRHGIFERGKKRDEKSVQDRKKKREREREREREMPKTVDGMMGNEGGTDREAQRGENKSERMR